MRLLIIKKVKSILFTFLFLALLGCAPSGTIMEVVPVSETEPVLDDDDAADDSVVLSSMDGQRVWIVGTNKRRGLVWYDIQGKELGRLEVGRLNNVDAVRIGDTNRFNLAAGNRTDLTIDLFEADLDEGLIKPSGKITLSLDDAYGLCALDSTIAIGDKSGNVQLWSWAEQSIIREIEFESSTEGCVFDSQNNHLFVGEEEKGIWRVELSSGEKFLFDDIDLGNLSADVEGLDIYESEDRHVLLASSQGDDTFVAYDIETGKVLSKFHVGESLDGKTDEVTHTDGISILSKAVRNFPEGLLVVQDDDNVDQDGQQMNQNFKVVDWRSVARLIQN